MGGLRLVAVVVVAVGCRETSPCRANAGPGGQPAGADWTRASRTWVYGQPALPYLSAVGGSVVAWSVYWGGVTPGERAYVDAAHAAGIRVASNFPTMQGSAAMTGDMDLVLRAASRDIKGQPARASWIQPEIVYLMCHNNPEWRAFLVRRALEHVGGGADGIHIDEVEGNGRHAYLVCFCPWCMQGFREHLARRYDARTLAESFGVADTGTFDYRAYLVAHGVVSALGDPNLALRREFLRFQFDSRRAQLRDLAATARASRATPVAFGANTFGLAPSIQLFLPMLDFVVYENLMGAPPDAKHLGLHLLAAALGPDRPAVMFADILTLARLAAEDWPVVRHWMAEAASAGQSFLVPHEAYAFGGARFHVTPDQISTMADYSRSVAAEAGATAPFARAAVLYDAGAAWAEPIDFAWLIGGGRTHTAFVGAARSLQKRHVPFAVVVVGDGDFVPEIPTAERLRDFDVLVVPGPDEPTPAARCLIDSFRRSGRPVVDTGSLATAEAGRLLETTAPESISVIPYRANGTLGFRVVDYAYDASAHAAPPYAAFDVTLTLPIGTSVDGRVLRMRAPGSAPADVPFTSSGRRATVRVPGGREAAWLRFE